MVLEECLDREDILADVTKEIKRDITEPKRAEETMKRKLEFEKRTEEYRVEMERCCSEQDVLGSLCIIDRVKLSDKIRIKKGRV